VTGAACTSPPIWAVLGAFWIIASFPAAVVIGRHLARRSSGGIEDLANIVSKPPPMTDQHADRLLRIVRKDGEPQ
jgi:hypothetical protein